MNIYKIMIHVIMLFLGALVMWGYIKVFYKTGRIVPVSHKCTFNKVLGGIKMENNTNFIVEQCMCGETARTRTKTTSNLHNALTWWDKLTDMGRWNVTINSLKHHDLFNDDDKLEFYNLWVKGEARTR